MLAMGDGKKPLLSTDTPDFEILDKSWPCYLARLDQAGYSSTKTQGSQRTSTQLRVAGPTVRLAALLEGSTRKAGLS